MTTPTRYYRLRSSASIIILVIAIAIGRPCINDSTLIYQVRLPSIYYSTLTIRGAYLKIFLSKHSHQLIKEPTNPLGPVVKNNARVLNITAAAGIQINQP